MSAYCDVCGSHQVVSVREGKHGGVIELCAVHWERDFNRRQRIHDLERVFERNGFTEVGATT